MRLFAPGFRRLALAIVLGLAAAFPVHAGQWMDVATISSTLGNNVGRLCVGGGRTDLGCPADAPLLDSARGLLTVPGDLRVAGNFYVSGTQSFDGVTFANGGISASSITINGQSVAGGVPDRIVSGTTNVIAGADGLIRLSTGGVSNTAYFDANGRLINAGVSSTGYISGTGIYSNGEIHSTADIFSGNRFWGSSVWLDNGGSIQWSNSVGVYGDGINNRLDITTNTSYALSIVSNGYVGLGGNFTHRNPSTTLHVSGTLRIGAGPEGCDTNRLGAIKYTGGDFYVCRNAVTGWEPITAGASAVPSTTVTTGVSGSLIYRDQSGTLFATNTLVISSTTGSIGIGAGAPANLGNNGLYASGDLRSGANIVAAGTVSANSSIYLASGPLLGISNGVPLIRVASGAADPSLSFAGGYNMPEALRIVSTGLIGIGTTLPSTTLHVWKGDSGFNGALNGRTVAAFEGSNIAGTAISILGPSTGNQSIYFGNNSNEAAGQIQYVASTDRMSFATNGGGNVFSFGAAGMSVGINATPSTSLQVSGTIQMSDGGETCNTPRLGALKYTSATFYVCQTTAKGWEPLATATSSTTPSISTGASGSIVYRDQNGYLQANSNWYVSNSNISLGTPYSWLGAMNNTLWAQGGVYTDGVARASKFAFSDGTAYMGGGSGAAAYINFILSSTEVMRIASNTYVGIGTSTPSATLHVSGTGLFTNSANIGAIGNTNSYLNFNRGSDGSAAANIGLAANDGNEFRFTHGRGSGYFTWYTNNGTNTAERMRLDTSGLVGIGTSTPSSALHLYGPSNTIGGITFSSSSGRHGYLSQYGNYSLALRGGSANASFYLQDGSANNVAQFELPTGKAIFGNMGTLTTAPSATIQISGSLRLSAEATGSGYETCDANRLGAIKYTAGDFYVCRNGTTWESFTSIATGAASLADRITSSSQAGVTANATGYISLTTGGVTGTVYFQPNGVLVNSGVSTTGPISGTSGYFSGNVGIGTTAPSYTLDLNNGQMRALRVITNRIGGSALANQSSGTNNYAFGGSALYTTTTGSNNIGIGYYAGFWNSTASNNVAVGGDSLRANTIGSGNTSIGGGAGTNIIGINNTFLGLRAGANLTSGTGNIFIGANTMAPQDLVSNTLNIGNAIYGLNISTSTPSIGIGTTSPTTALQVSGTIQMADGGEACDTNRIGAIKYTAGDFYVCRNGSAWESFTSIATGAASLADRITSGTTQAIAYNNTSLSLVTAGTERMVIGTTGNVGIAQQPATSYALAVSGSIAASGGVRYNPFSNGNIAFNNTANPAWGSIMSDAGTLTINVDSDANDGGTRYVQFKNGGFDIMRVGASSGFAPYVGIGTPSANNTLQVSGTFLVSRGSNFNPLFVNSNGLVGIGTLNPSTTLHVSGTIQIANSGEACDTSRLGAIKYASAQFYICRDTSTGWETLAAGGTSGTVVTDRITSGTTSVIVNSATGVISFTTNGTNAAYLNAAGEYISQNPTNGTSGTISRLRNDGALILTRPTDASAGTINGYIDFYDQTGVTNFGRFTYNTAGKLFTMLNATADANLLVTNIQASTGSATGASLATGKGLYVNGAPTISTQGGYMGWNVNVGDGRMYFMNQRGAGGGGFVFNEYTTSNTYVSTPLQTLGGRVGINMVSTSAPNTQLEVSGTIKIADSGESCATGTLGAIRYNSGAFYICRNTTSGWEPITAGATSVASPTVTTGVSGSLIYRDQSGNLFGTPTITASSTTGSLGIGGGAPANIGNDGLFVSGSTTIGAAVNVGGSFQFNTTTPRYISWNGTGGAYLLGDPVAKYLAIATNSVEAMRIVSNGMVGIGLAGVNPSATLHVVGPAGNQLMVGANSNGNSGIVWGSTVQGAQATIQTDSAHSMIFSSRNGGTIYERMRFNWTGNNGFGTSNPQTFLDVSGTLRLANSGEACDANRLGGIRYTGGAFSICQNITNGWEALSTSGISSTVDRIISGTTQAITYKNTSISLVTAGTERMVIGTTGAVAIGQQPTNGVALGVSGSATYKGSFTISTTDGNTTALYVSGTTGAIGINTTNPVANLDIRSGNLYVGDGTSIANASQYWALIDGNLGIMNNGSVEFNVGGTRTDVNANGVSRNSGSLTTFNFTNSGGMAVGVNTSDPSTTFAVSGTLRIGNAGEACDTNRLGAIKYASPTFYVCQNTTSGWQSLASVGASGVSTTLAIDDLSDAASSVPGHSVYLGSGSGVSITTATQNTAVGLGSMAQTTSGGGNVAVGYNALTTNATGANNLAIGTTALHGNVSGTANVAVGLQSLFVNTGGGRNAGLGNFALQFSTGSSNTAVGHNAGASLTAGDGNLFLGAQTTPYSTTGSNQLNIGNAIWGDLKDNSTPLAARIGINVTSPTANLEVSGTVSATRFVGDGSGLTNISGLTSDRITSGTTQAIAYSNTSLSLVTAGTERMVIGTTGEVGIATQPVAGNNLSVSGSVRIAKTSPMGSASGAVMSILAGTDPSAADQRLGILTFGSVGANPGYPVGINGWSGQAWNGTSAGGYLTFETQANNTVNGRLERMRITDAGNVGIGTTNPSYTLDVSGSARFSNSSNIAHVYIDRAAGKFGLLEYTTSSSERWATGVDAVAETGSNVGSNYFLNRYSDSGVFLGEPFLISRATGFVGIGLEGAIPSTSLQVSGTVTATKFVGDGSGLTGISGASGDRITSGTTQAIAYQNTSLSLVTSGTERMVIGGDGRVGIGQQPDTTYNFAVSGTSLVSGRLKVNTAIFSNSGTSVAVASGILTTSNEYTGFGISTGGGGSSGNTVMGYWALQSGAPGNYNTAVGNRAMYSTISPGTENTALGYNALFGNTTGSYNVALGSGAAGTFSIAPTGGVYVGFHAGSVSTGNYNVALGYGAASTLTTGANNILIGKSVQATSNTTSYGLNIGNSIFGDMTTASSTGGAALIGINTNAPTANLEVSGTVSATRFVGDGSGLTNLSTSGDRITSGTTSVITYNNTSATIATAGAERFTVGTTGLIGINNSAPETTQGKVVHLLNTANTGTADSNVTYIAESANRNAVYQGRVSSTGAVSLQALNWASSLNYGQMSVWANANNPFMAFYVSGTTSSPQERMRIDSNGNVGIGTTTPAYPLQISGTGSTAAMVMGTTGGFVTASRNFNSTAAVTDTLIGSFGFSAENTNPLQSSTAATMQAFVDAAGGARVKGRLVFGTSDGASVNEAMRINSLGRVGIGITTPYSALHVASTTGASSGLARFTTGDYVDNTTGSGLMLRTGANTGDTYSEISAFKAGFSAYSNLSLQSGGGGVGIGVTSPSATLDVSGSARFFSNSSGGNAPFLTLLNTSGANLGSYGPGIILNNSVSNTHPFIITEEQSADSFFSISNANSPYNAYLAINQTGQLAIGGPVVPSTTLQVAGSIRLGLETSATLAVCDTNRAGTIKYDTGIFYTCNGSTGWQPFGSSTSATTVSDRITSGTTQAIAYSNTSLSLITAGTERLVIGTSGQVGIASQPVAGYVLTVSGATSISGGRLTLNNGSGGISIGNAFTGVTNGNIAIGGYAMGSNTGSNGVAIGASAGQYNTQGQLVAIGNNAAQYNTGSNVTAVGLSAAQSNTQVGLSAFGYNAAQFNSGQYTTAIGYTAAQNNTQTGVTGVGYAAAQSNSQAGVTAAGAFAAQYNTGYQLTALGNSAGQNNSGGNAVAIGIATAQYNTGGNLTAVGIAAAQSNTQGNVTAIGYQTALNNTGANLSALGYQAAYSNSGANATAVGYAAGQNNTGIYTTAIGYNAALANTGSNIVAIGAGAGQNNTGNYLTSVGFSAAQYNTSVNNTAVGYQAMQFKAAGTNNTVFGYNAGLGVSNSTAYSNNSLFGSFAGTALTTGGSNTLIGYNTGAGITTGNNNLILGANLSPLSNTADNQLNIANAIFGNYSLPLAAKIGINVVSPTANLEVSGTISATSLVINGVPFTGAASSTTDRITSGTTSVITYSTGGTTISSTGLFLDNGNPAGDHSIRVGTSTTASHYSYLDLIGDSTYTTYGLRLIRNNAGANTSSALQHRGTGPLYITTIDAGPLVLQTSSTEALRIDPTGLIGIGIASPSAQLDVVSSSTTSSDTRVARFFSGAYATGFSKSTVRLEKGVNYGGEIAGYLDQAVGSGLTFSTLGGTTSSTERMRIVANGFVGIGTTAPQTMLDISGSMITRSDANGYGFFQAATGNALFSGTNYDRVEIRMDPSLPITTMGNVAGSTTIPRALALTAGLGSNIRMYISGTTGNVGINTTSPLEKLEVDGNLMVNTYAGGDGNGIFFRPLYTSAVSSTAYNLSLTLHDWSSVNTSSDGFLLSAYDGIGFHTGSNSFDPTKIRMFISGLGNIGMNIGSVLPSTTLQVGGTIRIADGGEACDANRLGAIKYSGGAFYVCKTAGAWDVMTTSGAGTAADRITSGTTQAIAYSNTSLSLITAGTERMVIGTAGNVGIATQPTAADMLTVSGTLRTRTSNGADAITQEYYSNDNASGNIVGQKGRGTLGTPLAVQSADRLLGLYARGYNGSALSSNAAAIQLLAAENFTTSTNASAIDFETTPASSSTRLERMRIDQNGFVGIGTPSPTAYLHIYNGSNLGTSADNTGEIIHSLNRNTSLRMVAGTGWTSTIYFRKADPNSTDNQGSINYDAGLGVMSFTASNSLVTSGTAALNIIANGYVGVGTPSPTSVFSVSSTNNINSGSNFANRVGAMFVGEDIAGLLFDSNQIEQVNPSNSLFLNFDSGAKTVINNGGGLTGIGAGSASPQTTLQVAGSIRFGTETSATLAVCDTNRSGTIKYDTGVFYTCDGTTGWKALGTGGAGASTYASLTDIAYNAANGLLSGPGSFASTSTVTNTTAFGIGALGGASNTGFQNSAFGRGVLGQNTTGSFNTSVGTNSMFTNSTGKQNTAIGQGSLQLNTTGSTNTAAGNAALQNNTTGSANTAIGQIALQGNTTGSYNTASGLAAMQNATSGSYNTATGVNALYYNTTGIYNVVMGFQSGVGVSNTTTYSGATILGTFAGTGLTTGSSNTLIGYNAGAGITTGANNLVIGASTSPLSNTADNQLNIANAIMGNYSLPLAAKIGVNVASPTANLEVSGTVSVTTLTVGGVPITGSGAGASTFASLTDVSYSLAGGNIYGPGTLTGAKAGTTNVTAFGVGALANATNSGNNNTAFGSVALNHNTTGAANAAIGFNALLTNTSGNNNVAMGQSALYSNTSGNDNIAIGLNTELQNTTGYSNIAIGTSALYGNVTGFNNTAVGASSMTSNKGYSNTAFGVNSLKNQMGGVENVAIGSDVMFSVATGTANVAVGASALNAVSSVTNTTAIGYKSGLGTSSSSYQNGTYLGAFTGYAVTTGGSNTLIGYNAGAGITTGANNLVIGASTSPLSNTADNQLNIANAIFGNYTSSLAALIGINVTSPTTALQVSGTIKTNAAAQVGNADTTCATSADYGKMRFDSGTSRLYLCRP